MLCSLSNINAPLIHLNRLFKQLRALVISPNYEGHSRINDNEFISSKVLLYSVLFIVPHGDTDITYSCLKFGAFIMARIDAMII